MKSNTVPTVIAYCILRTWPPGNVAHQALLCGSLQSSWEEVVLSGEWHVGKCLRLGGGEICRVEWVKKASWRRQGFELPLQEGLKTDK